MMVIRLLEKWYTGVIICIAIIPLDWEVFSGSQSKNCQAHTSLNLLVYLVNEEDGQDGGEKVECANYGS